MGRTCGSVHNPNAEDAMRNLPAEPKERRAKRGGRTVERDGARVSSEGVAGVVGNESNAATEQ